MWPDQLAAMADARQFLVARGAWTAGPSTLMRVLELSRAEVQNCRVLRWLLDPLARHGLGAKLITAFGAHVGVEFADPALVGVTVEVSREESRSDIVIEDYTGGRVIVIEAKIDAAEGVEQGRRLETDWPEANPLEFLTVDGARLPYTAAEPARWQAISWTWFANEVAELLDGADPTEDPRALDARRAAADWVAGTWRYLH
jgi:hypothetical protein